MSQPSITNATITFFPTLNLHDLEKALTQMDEARKEHILQLLDQMINRVRNRVRQTGA